MANIVYIYVSKKGMGFKACVILLYPTNVASCVSASEGANNDPEAGVYPAVEGAHVLLVDTLTHYVVLGGTGRGGRVRVVPSYHCHLLG